MCGFLLGSLNVVCSHWLFFHSRSPSLLSHLSHFPAAFIIASMHRVECRIRTLEILYDVQAKPQH